MCVLFAFLIVQVLYKQWLPVQALEAEMKGRQPQCEEVCRVGENLVNSRHYASNDIRLRINSLREKWQRLRDLVAQRRTRLEDAAESHQVSNHYSSLLLKDFCCKAFSVLIKLCITILPAPEMTVCWF